MVFTFTPDLSFCIKFIKLWVLSRTLFREKTLCRMPAPDVSFYIGQMTWAVVSLAPLANIPELVGPLLESLRAKKEHWTMPVSFYFFILDLFCTALVCLVGDGMNLCVDSQCFCKRLSQPSSL